MIAPASLDARRLPVKVCCIQDHDEAALAVRCGAASVGLVSRMPSGWGPIPDEAIAEIARRVPPFVVTMLLSSHTEPRALIAQQRQVRCRAIQIVDAFPEDGYPALREALPGVTLFKVVHVTGPEALDEARRVAPLADGLILDSGGGSGETRVLGGTGLTHDWSISAQIVASVQAPVLLAGGLKPHNVAEAIRTVAPHGLDLCTGVRIDHRLDEALLRAFLAAAVA